MSLKETIMADVKSAMKAGNQAQLSCLRFLQAAIKNREIEIRPKEITEEEVTAVIKKQIKQRQDAIEQYEKAGRNDLATKEKMEMAILEAYLPDLMGADQLETIVDEVVKALGATSAKQMGAVMKEVLARTAGAADNRLVSEMVKKRLS